MKKIHNLHFKKILLTFCFVFLMMGSGVWGQEDEGQDITEAEVFIPRARVVPEGEGVEFGVSDDDIPKAKIVEEDYGGIDAGATDPFFRQLNGIDGPSTMDIEKPKGDIPSYITWMIKILNYLIYAMITFALLLFLYGVLKTMFVDGTKEESRKNGRYFMMWGIISLFVMISVWGLVNILKESFFGGGGLIIPQLK